MRLRGIQGRLLLILALSSLAMVVASFAAFRALDEIGAVTETMTGRDVPAVTSSLRLAQVGERLQQRGASLMAAGTPEALARAEQAITADLEAFAREAEALQSVQALSGEVSTLSVELAKRLHDLRRALAARSVHAENLEISRLAMRGQAENVRQLIGPSILAIEAITSGRMGTDMATFRIAIRSQAPLLAAERLTDQVTALLFQAQIAEDARSLVESQASYRRTVSQLEALVPNLPAGLRGGFSEAVAAFADQSGADGIMALRLQELAALKEAEAALEDSGKRAEALKQLVDSRVIAASRSMAEATEDLRQTILSRNSQFALIGLAVILGAAGLSYLFVIRPLSRNLAAVTESMTRLAAGERELQVPGAERRDEIGDLARAFTVFKDNAFQMEQLDRELAERSNLLLATFETMKDGFSVFDSERRLVAWNPQYLAHYQLEEADISDRPDIEEVNRRLAARGVRAFLPNGEETDMVSLSHRRLLHPQRHELRFADGQVLELRSNPIPQGGFATIHMDVTEQRGTESQLLQAQKMETVGQLTGGIAHDFNNILAVIIGNLNILERETAEVPELQARAERALGAADRAAGLVNRLLAFSRRQRLAPENIDINALVRDMHELLETSVGSAVTLRMDLAEDLPQVRVDPGQLENALMNLAINARDAMEGEGEIAISTRAASGDFIELSVSDTGSGIAPELLEQVFEPFFTTKPVGKGSGLGLSMVYGFAQQSGGNVHVESAPGVGTKVTLSLPVTVEAAPEEAPEQVSGEGAGDACILVVDDDADLLEIAADQLRAHGYAVVTALDGATALEVLAEIPEIDLLYTDLAMPGEIDGFALAREAEKIRPDLPVLFTSGAPGEAGAGLPNLLRKPVPEETLLMAVRLQLETYSRRTSVSST
ncbi:ATP-binding protein [Aliiruegeria lutimaris]|uniref:histidine kinase n=1 Tax=Aliiruegeria lutimaris TaxID=571298 RepID=A0A1G8YUG7_9RHOB|nr:ATP-binding protein [Aliiruegeria lutimaris]SDK06064.1 HAMP domain-containing protein [Aliiruegeria lutimaris]